MLDDRALFRTHAEHMSAYGWVRFHVSLPEFPVHDGSVDDCLSRVEY